MPRLIHRSPAYRKHKASGQAVVTLNGDDVYLGDHGTKASRDKYDRVIGEWLATGRRRVPSRGADVDVVEVLNAYRKFARDYYDGPNSGELHSVLLALKVVNRLYGPTAAADFGPLAMRAVRDEMVKLGWSRKYVNAQVGRVRRMFKWAVERELVPPSVLLGLQAVAGLRQGKTDAPESEPVMPVADEHVNATLPYLSRQVRAMVELQRLTGMRPGEVCAMRSGDIHETATPDSEPVVVGGTDDYTGGNYQSPSAVPSPTAAAGGVALLGAMALTRRKGSAAEDVAE